MDLDEKVRVPMRGLLSQDAIKHLSDNLMSAVGDQLLDVVYEIEFSFPQVEKYWDADLDQEGDT
jgi:hypothetical protein